MNKSAVLLCGPPSSAVGGGPTHIKNIMASPLSRQYSLVHFETGSRGSESPAKNEAALSKVIRIATSPFALAWCIVRSRPHVVHLNSVLDHKAFWRDFIYFLVSKSLGRRTIIQLHGGSLSALCRGSIMRYLVRRTFSTADAVVLLASSERRDFEAQLGITQNVLVIPNAVDITEYRTSVERVHSGKVCHIAYLGRILRTKGILEAIRAISILRSDDRFKNLRLSIAGSGPDHEEIAKFIDSQGLQACVKLLGPLYGREKLEFLRQADLFLFPSYHPEGLPYAILESLAAGTPVIASRVAGIPDVVVDGVHGILIDPRNPDEIVRGICNLARSPEALRGMSRNCAEWAFQNFGLERLADQFDKLYQRVGMRPHFVELQR